MWGFNHLATAPLLLSRATPLSSIGRALLLALLHWVRFSLGWYLQPPPPTATVPAYDFTS